MSNIGTNLEAPMFLKAASPLGLRRLMIMNNLKTGNRYKYQDIQYVNGYWFCWYYKESGLNESIKEISKKEL